MGKHGNRALPKDQWPDEDKIGWETAFRRGSLLNRGAGNRLSTTSAKGLERAHGMVLQFFLVHHPDRLSLSPTERLTRKIVGQFMNVVSGSCRDTTIGSMLHREYLALQLIAPEADLDWLARIVARVRKRAKPLEHRQITSLELYQVGHSLLEKARTVHSHVKDVPLWAAELFRDGFMIKLLATYPMRRFGFARLELETTFFRRGDSWAIYLPPELVKTGVSQDYLLSAALTADADEYLTVFRPMFPQSTMHNWLWPYKERRMGDRMIRRYVRKHTERALGHAVTPHRFRNAGATYISIADPANILAAKDLLGHGTFAMTEKHYIDGAQSREAGIAYADIIDGMVELEGTYDASEVGVTGKDGKDIVQGSPRLDTDINEAPSPPASVVVEIDDES